MMVNDATSKPHFSGNPFSTGKDLKVQGYTPAAAVTKVSPPRRAINAPQNHEQNGSSIGLDMHREFLEMGRRRGKSSSSGGEPMFMDGDISEFLGKPPLCPTLKMSK